MNRLEILKAELEINSNDVSWCFISDYYDAPIVGLLYYKNKIWKFCCFEEDIPGQMIYVILQLSESEISKELESKDRFEKMVGTHWSFDIDGNKLPESDATLESQSKYYETKEEQEFSPYTHGIEAWFNVARKY